MKNLKTTRTLLQEIMKRPGMYFGEPRLDYLRIFYTGYVMGASLYDWDENYDMQQWLFTQESISIQYSCSISSWSLFNMYYGIDIPALEQFKKLIHEIPFSVRDDNHIPIADRIFSIYLKEKENEYGISQDIALQRRYIVYQTTVSRIEDMINTEEYDNLLIYIYRDIYFMQLRFFYRNKQGEWIDGINKQVTEENKLIYLHALVNTIKDDSISTIQKSNGVMHVTEEALKKKLCHPKHGLPTATILLQNEDALMGSLLQKWKEKWLK